MPVTIPFHTQLVTVLNLYLRGENLWRLSLNIFAVFAICLMSFFQTTTEPNDEPNAEPNTFFLIPLGYLIIALLLVDEEKFVRGLFSHSSTTVEHDFEFKYLPKFRPDLFNLFDPYTGESFNTYSLVGLHGQYLYRSMIPTRKILTLLILTWIPYQPSPR